MKLKLIPRVSYRDNAQSTLTRTGDSLNGLDLSGDWVKLEWGEDEDKGLIQSATKEGDTVTVHVTASQPEEYKRARTMGVLDAMEQPIYLADGESVTFPDFLKERADNVYKNE